MQQKPFSRRRLLKFSVMLPFGALIAACGGDALETDEAGQASSAPTRILEEATAVPPKAVPTATATPEPPFIVPAGETQSVLMAGTPQETPLHVFGTGAIGPIVMVLGGVHGNEPGGWLAAERLVQQVRPDAGALIVLPNANRQAMALFARTTDELGDLNRLYPGDPDGLPMARMAYEIVETLRDYHVSLVIDMHESWSFFRDRTDTATGTAYLGQTMSSRGDPGASLAAALVDAINSTRIQAAHEEFTFREWPPRGFALPTGTPGGLDATQTPERGTTGPTAQFGGSRSSLGLPNHVPGLAAILVEMGQQQDIERRVQLHVDVVQEALNRLGA